MIDLKGITGFQWDAGNLWKSIEKHGVTIREAEEIFLDPNMLILKDEAHSDAEPRFHAYGVSSAGRRLLISFTLRQNGQAVRVISTRNMSRRERRRYAEEI